MVTYFHIVFRQWNITDASTEIFFEIEPKHPKKLRCSVQNHEIDVLETVHWVVFLRFAHPQEWAQVNVVVHAIHICEGMMNSIVLQIPHKMAAAQDTQCASSDFIEVARLRKAPVRAIVHNVEADARRRNTQNNAQRKGNKSGFWREKHDRCVANNAS